MAWRIPFSPAYKLAQGYVQLVTVGERVPKIDGYTMPPPRTGGANTVMDKELNAMFKSVLHRPTSPCCHSESMLQDPLQYYMLYHGRPSDEHPQHPWTQNTAFSGSWYAYFESIEKHARKASRKLLARQELETLWETEEMQTVLGDLAGITFGIPTTEQSSSSISLDHCRLTCEEYVAFVTAQVVKNMDAIAWARVNRKTRMPELVQHLAVLPGAEEDESGRTKNPACETNYDDGSSMMSTPGLLRKVSFPFRDLETAFSYVEGQGKRSTQFAKTLDEFFTTQKLTLAGDPLLPSTAQGKQFWANRAKALTDVHNACVDLRNACASEGFVGNCLVEQTSLIRGAPADCHQADDADDVLDAHWGVTLTSVNSILPVGWIEPAYDSMTPSGYLTKLLSELPDRHYPTRQQLEVLAVCVEHLDIVKMQESDGVPWELRVQLVILLLGQGGSGKTWMVQQILAGVVAYAFGTDEAIRMVAFSNPQATNLSSDRFPASTVHRASEMRVQKLANNLMSPGDKLSSLQAFWGPPRAVVAEEITMWPAEVFNMGLLRSAWGRQEKCDLDMDAYRFKGNLWGRCPLILELGDPLQMRPVRSVSLFDTPAMLKERFEKGEGVSIESQYGIKSFNIYDYAFELTETKRFVTGNPIIAFLQSLREADSENGKIVDVGLWNLFQSRCVKTSSTGDFMKDARLQQKDFQAGYFVSYYWHAVIRFFFARARREARLLSVPLFWIQAADDIKGFDAQPKEEQEKVLKALLRNWNIHDTAHLHTLLPAYPGQRVRLTEKISADHRLVQEAEGTVVQIVLDVQEIIDVSRGEVALQYCPQGIWVCFDDCKVAPLAGRLSDKIDPSARDALCRLNASNPDASREPDSQIKPVHERMVFVPAVTRSFKRTIAGKIWMIRRRQVPLTSALDRTIQSSQGKTFRSGLVGDMGNLNSDRDSFWSAMYVLLSRATRMEDMLLLRCPPKSFFDAGPPAYLKSFLQRLHGTGGKIAAGRQKGDELIVIASRSTRVVPKWK